LVRSDMVHDHPHFHLAIMIYSYYYATYSSEIYLFHNPFQIFIYHHMQRLGDW
jgi:hypothetical protein